jgi:hypothetical protein
MIRVGGATRVYERHGKVGSLRAWGRIGSGFGPSCMAEVGFASGPRELQFVGKYGYVFGPKNFTAPTHCAVYGHTQNVAISR